MELNELKPAWQAYQAMQSLDAISERQLNYMMAEEPHTNTTKVKVPMFKYVLAHTLLLLVCQSC